MHRLDDHRCVAVLSDIRRRTLVVALHELPAVGEAFRLAPFCRAFG
jgi:hypothetical protein